MAKLKRKATPVKPMYTPEDYSRMGQEYLDLSATIKELESKKKSLATLLKGYAESSGVKNDKGSYYCEDDSIVIGSVAKKKVSVDEEGLIEYLERKGLGDLIDVVTVTTKNINEDKLTSAISTARISLEEVEAFTSTSTSYSISVQAKEQAAEIVTGELSKASRKK